jgi:hypothetical protein
VAYGNSILEQNASEPSKLSAKALSIQRNELPRRPHGRLLAAEAIVASCRSLRSQWVQASPLQWLPTSVVEQLGRAWDLRAHDLDRDVLPDILHYSVVFAMQALAGLMVNAAKEDPRSSGQVYLPAVLNSLVAFQLALKAHTEMIQLFNIQQPHRAGRRCGSFPKLNERGSYCPPNNVALSVALNSALTGILLVYRQLLPSYSFAPEYADVLTNKLADL